jgi:hypothetical protein
MIKHEEITFLENFKSDFFHKCSSPDNNGCFNLPGFSVDEESIFSVKDWIKFRVVI